ncbi:MAG: hypothetical protein Q4G26_10805 [Paracoccus sp. (in: a-proteobacteria)]|nr:hypothetical protein [Paracoccus sp. (in: a-proteobacteria)]
MSDLWTLRSGCFRKEPSPRKPLPVSLNNRVVIERSQKARNEGGAVNYMEGQGDALDFSVAWYDISDDRGYAGRFRLHASDLSLIGESGHAAVRIIVGPGADVTATTPHAGSPSSSVSGAGLNYLPSQVQRILFWRKSAPILLATKAPSCKV